MQKDFEERKESLNDMFERKRGKKRERRKKKEDKKKMVKKLSKLAEGVNKYNVNGNYIEQFQKEVQENPEIIAQAEENDQKNFDEFDYNVEVPKEMKKQIKKNEVVQPEESVQEEFNESEYEDSYIENESELEIEKNEVEVEEVKTAEEVKVKEMPRNVVIIDNDL
jgi:hypothetical protein